jgi:hypothetical protein
MSIIEISLVLMGLALLAVAFIGNKALKTNSLISNAGSSLRMASEELDNMNLGVDPQKGTLRMQSIQSMSPLPTAPEWNKVRQVLSELQGTLNGLVQSDKIWIDLSQKYEDSYKTLEDQVKVQMDQNKAIPLTQDVWMAAQTIHDWIKKNPTNAADAAFLDGQMKLADSLLESNKENLAVLDLGKKWTSWIAATNELLLEDKTFAEQKKSSNLKMSAYGTVLENQAAAWLNRTRTTSLLFIGLFALLLAVIIFSLQSIKKNPHMNTMFTPKGPEALQAELATVTGQVDMILASVDKAWVDSRSELKVVHHAIEDSEVLESQVQQLKADFGTVINHLSKGLQELEHKVRKSDTAGADQLALLLSETQSQGSRIQQSLESLTESGMSIHEELQQVQKTIKRLMSETLALKHEGEVLEESSETLRSSAG